MKKVPLAAALLLASLGTSFAQQQGQNGRFCFTADNGGQNCGFQTLAQCEAARKGVSRDVCVPNPQFGQDQRRPAPTAGSNR